VIWNADTMRRNRENPDRVLFWSTTNGGKKAVVIAQMVGNGRGVRPVAAWEQA